MASYWSYFPQDMLYELRCSYNNTAPEPPVAPAPPASESAPGGADPALNADANQDAGPPEGSPPSGAPPANEPPTSIPPPVTRFSVVHTIRYSPWAPGPGNERAESQVIGTCGSLYEANELAMKEVYEKYGDLAHTGRNPWEPPNPTWLHKKGGNWPNTWSIEDGRLSFSLINSKLHYTLWGNIDVVSC